MSKIGGKVNFLRTKQGLSIERLSSLASVSMGYISGLEKGEHAKPTIPCLKKIAYALDVDIDYFLNSDHEEESADFHVFKNRFHRLTKEQVEQLDKFWTIFFE